MIALRFARLGSFAVATATVSIAVASEPSPTRLTDSLRVLEDTVGATEIVLSPRASSPAIVACAGVVRPGIRDGLATRDETAWAHRRGATVWSTRARGGSLDCVAAPRTELAFVVWLGCRWLARERTAGESFDPSSVADRVTARGGALLAEQLGSTTAPSPGPRVLSVTGAADVSDVRALVGEHCKVPAAPARAAKRPAPFQSSERLSVMEDASTPVPEAHYFWRLGADPLATELALAILGAGDASRLGDNVVRRRRLANESWSFAIDHEGERFGGVAIRMNPAVTVDRAQRFVDGAIRQLRFVGPAPAELARARALMVTERWSVANDPQRLVEALADRLLRTGDAAGWVHEVDEIHEIGVERVKRAAHDDLVDTARAMVELYPPDWPKDDPTLAGYTLYTVAEGDSWAVIAARFGVTAPTIAKANDLDTRHRLTAGQALWIPPR